MSYKFIELIAAEDEESPSPYPLVRSNSLGYGSPEPGSLPDNVIRSIFRYGGPEDLVVWGKICRLWYNVSRDNSLWITYHTGGLQGFVEDHKERIQIRNQEIYEAAMERFLFYNQVYSKLCLLGLPLLLFLLPLLLLMKLQEWIHWFWIPTILPLDFFFAFLAQFHLYMLRYVVDTFQFIHELRKGLGFTVLACYSFFLSGVADGTFRPHGDSYFKSVLPPLIALNFVLSPPLPKYREIADMLFFVSVPYPHRMGGVSQRVYLALITSLCTLLFVLDADSYISIPASLPLLLAIWLIIPLLSSIGYRYFHPLTWTDVTATYLLFLWQLVLWLIPYLTTANTISHKSYFTLFVPYWVFLIFTGICIHFRWKNPARFLY